MEEGEGKLTLKPNLQPYLAPQKELLNPWPDQGIVIETGAVWISRQIRLLEAFSAIQNIIF